MSEDRKDLSETRRQELHEELSGLGISSYEHLLKKHQSSSYDFDDYDFDEQDRIALIQSYIRTGFPTAREVSKVLAPIFRSRMLDEEGCKHKTDPRCVDFINGTSCQPGAETLGRIMLHERQQRRLTLARALDCRGFPTPNDPSVTLTLPWDLEKCLAKYLNEGYASASSSSASVDVELISGAILAAYRYQELKTAFKCRELNASLPRVSYHVSSPHRVIEVNTSADQECDPRVIDFLKGSSMKFTAAQLCARLETERTDRSSKIMDGLRQFDLSVESIPRHRHHASRRCIDDYVERNCGDDAQVISQFVEIVLFDRLDEVLLRKGLPRREAFIAKQENMIVRFSDILEQGGDNNSMERLADCLFKEQANRSKEIFTVLTSLLDAHELAMLNDAFRAELDTSDYVRFGIGGINDAAEAFLCLVRERVLQKAICAASPRLEESSISVRKEFDIRCTEYYEGSGLWLTAEELVALWQSEEVQRRERISMKLVELGLESPDHYYSTKCSRFVSVGDGTEDEVVQEVAEHIRRGQLEKEAIAVGISWWTVKDDARCEAFISRDSSCNTAAEVVGLIVQERSERKERIDSLVGKTASEEENVVDCCFFEVTDVLETYVTQGEGDPIWISGAIRHAIRWKAVEKAFGRLSGLMPSLVYDRVCAMQREVQAAVLETMVERLVPMPAPSPIPTMIEEEIDSVASSDQTLPQLVLDILNVQHDFGSMFYADLRENDGCDIRLAALVAGWSDCPWKGANEAAAALRAERKRRISEIDAAFQEALKDMEGRMWSRTSIVENWKISASTAYAKQDLEDSITHDSGPRADFINGKISLDEAVRQLTRMTKVEMLQDALSESLPLQGKPMRLECCKAFVNSEEGIVDAKPKLAALVKKLQNERAARCQLLDDAFTNANVVDLGVGVDSLYGHDDDEDGDFLHLSEDGHDNDNFPSAIDVSSRRHAYVELGEGKPEDVVRAAVMYQRMELLSKSLEEHFAQWNYREVEEWMENSDECKGFVADVDNGMSTKAKVEEFILRTVAQLSEEELKKASYCSNDDSYGGGCDSK